MESLQTLYNNYTYMHVVGTRNNVFRVSCMDTVLYGAECLSAYYILIYVITRTHSMYVHVFA